MLPVVTEFVRKYSLDDFIVVADSGLMNGNNTGVDSCTAEGELSNDRVRQR